MLVGDGLVVDHEPVGVEIGRGPGERFTGKACGHQGPAQESRDTDARRPGPEQHDALLHERHARGPDAGQHSRHRHGCRALNVVVEAREACLVPVEQTKGVDLLEVLPLQEGPRKPSLDRSDELVDQSIVVRPAHPARSPPEVERIVQEGHVVRAHVEADRKGLPRWDPRTRGVEGELAHRDSHAPRTLVAQAEDSLVVGDHDEADVVEGCVAQHLTDAPPMPRGNPKPAAAAEDVTPLLTGSADRGRVDDGQELLEVVDDQTVEEPLVAVLKCRQADVLLQGVGLAGDVLVDPLLLLLDRARVVGQKPFEAKGQALLFGEGRALCIQGMLEQARTSVRAVQQGPTFRISGKTVAFHDVASLAKGSQGSPRNDGDRSRRGWKWIVWSGGVSNGGGARGPLTEPAGVRGVHEQRRPGDPVGLKRGRR